MGYSSYGECLRNVPFFRKLGDFYLLAWHALCLETCSTVSSVLALFFKGHRCLNPSSRTTPQPSTRPTLISGVGAAGVSSL